MKITGNKRQHDNIENFVRNNASMMAKHAEENPNAAKRYRSIYKCKDCNKEYNSFQALGGHRAAHKNIRIETGLDGILSLENRSKIKLHYCNVCGKGFPIGQALGGHKRMHYNRKNTDDHDKVELSEEGVDSKAIVPYNNPSDSSSSSTIASNSKSKEVFEFDLNLTPYENESVNLGLQLQVNSS
uniref:zinc finger protein ZAT12-like n=1 Tax=Erigeron canadensis TaxID=72917 RepID=UPI001CB8D936|nr:zinc finger protein ZAT12-like [Erigeron canadensis]